MNNSCTKRRERFLNDGPYAQFVRAFSFGLEECAELLRTRADALAKDDPRHIDWRWGVGSYQLQLLIGEYSVGSDIESIASRLPPTLIALEKATLPQDYKTEPFYLTEPDSYAYAMWLLSLAKLLRLDYLVPRVAGLFDVARSDNRGQDALFESLLEKLGLPHAPTAKCLKNMKAHPLLLEAIQVHPAQRPKRVAQFLDKWYPSMKACYWHGRHTRVPQNFFGYWAFEAGLVTYLWDIDDSSYRHMPFYPKDLVDYARSHEAAEPVNDFARSIRAGRTADERYIEETQRLRCPAGQPCPREGYWFTPAAFGAGPQLFKYREIMPEIKSDYGSTIWQWSLSQTPVNADQNPRFSDGEVAVLKLRALEAIGVGSRVHCWAS